MKKIFIIFIGIILVIGLFSGCSSKSSTGSGSTAGGNAPVSYQNSSKGTSSDTSSSATNAASTSSPYQSKLTIVTVKGMSDQELIQNATKGQQQLNLDDVQNDVQNSITTSDLDQLLANQDPIANIPKK